jgi:hypothetical protein
LENVTVTQRRFYHKSCQITRNYVGVSALPFVFYQPIFRNFDCYKPPITPAARQHLLQKRNGARQFLSKPHFTTHPSIPGRSQGDYNLHNHRNHLTNHNGT